MDKRISEILGIVREEVTLYRDLIEHARKKTALLVKGSLDAILESNKVEETYSIRLRILENEMANLCQEICRALNIPREEFTLLKLAEGLDQSTAAEIQSQTCLFRNLVDQLKSVNQRNRKLIESSMQYSHGLLSFISNATSSYQESGFLKPIPAVPTSISRQA